MIIHTPHYENVPFEVPAGWCWTTLGEIGTWQAGGTPSRMHKEYYGGNIPWLKTGDLNDGLITTIPEYITEEGLKNSSAKLNPAGSVLIAMYGATIGKVGILGIPATTNQACCACIDYNGIIQKYLFYFLLSHKEDFIALGGGGAQPNISKDIIVKTFIPVPPIQEQIRIVSEIEGLLALLDSLDNNKAMLGNAINRAKSKILDLAIHGKLVPQDPSDESASELLKRINPKAIITGDSPQYQNNHFEIPDSWQWCLINDLFEITMGQSPEGETYNNTHGIEFHQGKIYFSERYLDKSDVFTTKPTKIAKAGSILMCVRAPVGIINITQRDICIGRGLCALKCKDVIEPNYAFYALQTIQSELESKATGSTFKAISCSIIRNEFLPLPPYEEQTRIVAKIQELNECICSILNQIEA